MRRATRPGGSSWRKLCRSFLLPLLLLLVQQGALLHELTHYTASSTQDEGKKQHSRGEPCALCAAYAQVAAGAAPSTVVAASSSDLAFQAAPPPPALVGSTRPPSQRSRGPPANL